MREVVTLDDVRDYQRGLPDDRVASDGNEYRVVDDPLAVRVVAELGPKPQVDHSHYRSRKEARPNYRIEEDEKEEHVHMVGKLIGRVWSNVSNRDRTKLYVEAVDDDERNENNHCTCHDPNEGNRNALRKRRAGHVPDEHRREDGDSGQDGAKAEISDARILRIGIVRHRCVYGRCNRAPFALHPRTQPPLVFIERLQLWRDLTQFAREGDRQGNADPDLH